VTKPYQSNPPSPLHHTDYLRLSVNRFLKLINWIVINETALPSASSPSLVLTLGNSQHDQNCKSNVHEDTGKNWITKRVGRGALSSVPEASTGHFMNA
jgi:hypothetical protein